MTSDPVAAIDGALDEHEEAQRAARALALDEEAGARLAALRRGAVEALATLAGARRYGVEAPLVERLVRRARIAVATLEPGPERTELEDEVARITRGEDAGEVEPHEEEPMHEEASMETENETMEPTKRRGRPPKISSETSVPETAPTRGAKRRRSARSAPRTGTRPTCSRCGKRMSTGAAAQERHAQRCEPASSSAARPSGAKPEEALARCREALAPLAPAVRKLALDLLVATVA